MPLEVLYAFSITCFLLIITPGPDLLYVVSQSITKGQKYGYAIVVGQVGGLVFHLALFAFGVSTLIINSEFAFKAVKIIGAAYLLWLSYKVFQEDQMLEIAEVDENEKEKSLLSFAKKGLLMNVMNPKVMMFFLALFPGFISEQFGSVRHQVFVLGGMFVSEALVVSFIICAVASQLTRYVQGNKIVNTVLKWLQIVVFSSLAIFLLVSS